MAVLLLILLQEVHIGPFAGSAQSRDPEGVRHVLFGTWKPNKWMWASDQPAAWVHHPGQYNVDMPISSALRTAKRLPHAACGSGGCLVMPRMTSVEAETLRLFDAALRLVW